MRPRDDRARAWKGRELSLLQSWERRGTRFHCLLDSRQPRNQAQIPKPHPPAPKSTNLPPVERSWGTPRKLFHPPDRCKPWLSSARTNSFDTNRFSQRNSGREMRKGWCKPTPSPHPCKTSLNLRVLHNCVLNNSNLALPAFRLRGAFSLPSRFLLVFFNHYSVSILLCVIQSHCSHLSLEF